jgi:hypothetical protein
MEKLIILIVLISSLKVFGQCGPYNTMLPIVFNGAHDLTITNVKISNMSGDCIYLLNCYNITIKNSNIGPSSSVGIRIEKCKNITVINCLIDSNISGVNALNSKQIRIDSNQIVNSYGPVPRGQAVQFNRVSGLGNSVSYNSIENVLNRSYPEDAISMYKSNGTSLGSIMIIGNRIRGGGPSTTGGGIMLGDAGGSYQIAKGNILVNPGQYGIGISSGTHMQILNNTIFAKKQNWTNVGIYVYNQYSTTCAHHVVSGNIVTWTNNYYESNTSWNSGNCGTVLGWSTNNWNAVLDSSILPPKIINCK